MISAEFMLALAQYPGSANYLQIADSLRRVADELCGLQALPEDFLKPVRGHALGVVSRCLLSFQKAIVLNTACRSFYNDIALRKTSVAERDPSCGGG